MSVCKKPSVYVCRGIEFRTAAEAEFYEAGQLVKDHLNDHPEYKDKGADFAAQVAVNVIFEHFQTTLRTVYQ